MHGMKFDPPAFGHPKRKWDEEWIYHNCGAIFVRIVPYWDEYQPGPSGLGALNGSVTGCQFTIVKALFLGGLVRCGVVGLISHNIINWPSTYDKCSPLKVHKFPNWNSFGTLRTPKIHESGCNFEKRVRLLFKSGFFGNSRGETSIFRCKMGKVFGIVLKLYFLYVNSQGVYKHHLG